MKILLTADWHFHDTNRLDDFIAATTKMVDYAIDHKIKDIFIVGDMYFNWKPSSVERMALHSVLAKAVFAGIDVVIVMGNHDVNEKEQRFIQHALSEFIDISSEHITLVYSRPHSRLLRFGGKSYGVFMIPHLSKAYLAQVWPDGAKYKEAFLDAIKQGNASNLILSHTLVLDAIDGPVNPENERGVQLSDFRDVLKVPMFMGDIHGHKILQQNPVVGYISSPERITFNEVDDQKGFVVYDLAESSYEFIPLATRKFFQISMDLEKNEFSFRGAGSNISAPIEPGDRTDILVAIIRAAADQIQDAVVKLVITGHKQDLALINRHAVISYLKQCNPFRIVKVAFDSTDDTAARDASFTGHLTAQDAFRRWTDKQVYEDRSLGAAVFKCGMEMLDEA